MPIIRRLGDLRRGIDYDFMNPSIDDSIESRFSGRDRIQ